MIPILRSAALVVVALTSAAPVLAQQNSVSYSFYSRFSAAQEVPTGSSGGAGEVTLTFSPALKWMRFDFRVVRTATVVAAHIHCGQAGTNGPIVAFLYDGSGTLGQGRLRNRHIVPQATACGDPVNNIASLFNAMRKGNTYVNVHTTSVPSGEVRAQIFP